MEASHCLRHGRAYSSAALRCALTGVKTTKALGNQRIHALPRMYLQVEETTELIALQLAGLAAASAIVTAPEIWNSFQVSRCFSTTIPCRRLPASQRTTGGVLPEYMAGLLID